MVRDASPLKSADEVDRAGTRMTVGNASAYELYLTRTLQHAEITRAPTSAEAIELSECGLRRIRRRKSRSRGLPAATHDGVRLLDSRFMVIEQAMVTTHESDRALYQRIGRRIESFGLRPALADCNWSDRSCRGPAALS